MIYAVASGRGFDLTFLAAHLCGGGLMLGAFFMATDYVTSPITPAGKVVGKFEIDAAKCVDCGSCAGQCPVGAISEG